jgi:hypothetical protein
MTLEEQVTRALTSWGIQQREIGSEIGTSGAWVSNVRRGIRHSKVCPDLPRWRSCEACRHWWPNRCTLGLPDLEEHGDLWLAGTECSAFVGFEP